MINFGKINIKLIGIILSVFGCILLTGCGGDSGTENNKFSINVYGLNLEYNGKIELEKVWLKDDDLNEIVDLFQEIGDDSKYKDSLLIAEEYAQGFGANKFSQDNLDVLRDQGLTLSNIKRTQIGLKKQGKNVNAVLVEYEITQGLIEDIPPLYVSQLFIPNDNNMILISYITEDKPSHLSASDMFKNIK